MSEPGKPSCNDCMFYDAGKCRRFPPQFNLNGANINAVSPSTYSYGASPSFSVSSYHTPEFPQVNQFDWCGEHIDERLADLVRQLRNGEVSRSDAARILSERGFDNFRIVNIIDRLTK